MQLFAEEGLEDERCEGLGFVKGTVEKIDVQNSKLRLPHIGWNTVTVDTSRSSLVKTDAPEPIYYFVHSYHMVPENQAIVTGYCDYGVKVTAIIEQENVYGTQFHPEKSHKDGIELLRNFLVC